MYYIVEGETIVEFKCPFCREVIRCSEHSEMLAHKAECLEKRQDALAQEAALRGRYQTLVEKQFTVALTPEEDGELNLIDELMSQAEESFYRPIIERLQRHLAELSSSDGQT